MMKDNTILFDTEFLQLKQVQSPSGHFWFYAHRPNINGIVVIIPIIGDEILFLETLRPPIVAEGIAKTCIELPAGLVGDTDKEETLIDAAKKELLEETGYKADSIEICAQNCASSPGATSEVFTIVIAKITDKNVQQEYLSSDGGIILKRHIVKMKDVKNWLKEQEQAGKSISSQTYAGLFFIPRQEVYFQ